MENTSRLKQLLHTSRDECEAHDWVFSLTPVGVAFVFYLMFIMSANIERSGMFIAFGAAAGFIGLESYWVVRGWKKKHLSTIVLSTLAIALTVGLLNVFMHFV
jgi:hypothetical protein